MHGNQFARTDKAIIEAFLRLLDEKPFEKITVQDIMTATPINRSNFYKHFRDKYEIAERLQDQILELIRTSDIEKTAISIADGQLDKKMYANLRKHKDVFLALLNVKTEKVDLEGRLLHMIRQRYLQKSCCTDPRFQEVEANCYAYVLTQYIVYTIEHDIDLTRMILDLDTICTDVMLTFLSLNREGENTVRKTLDELKQKRMITNFYENES